MDAHAKSPAHYLHRMAEYARMVKDVESTIDPAAWAADKRYVRINGGGIRTVSLCSNSPCGAVAGHPTRKTTHRLLEARHARIPEEDRVRPKPEHRMQAALIEHALRWPGDVRKRLHLADECDALRFVTDELKVGEIRADVVLAGCKDKVWFPVFIELKFGRNKTTVLGQLDKIAGVFQEDAEAADAFVQFMRASASLDGAVDMSKALKVVIWPAAKGTPRTEGFPKGVHVLEFDKERQLPERYDEPVLDLVPARLGTGL